MTPAERYAQKYAAAQSDCPSPCAINSQTLALATPTGELQIIGGTIAAADIEKLTAWIKVTFGVSS